MAWCQQGAVLEARLFADAPVALQNLHLMAGLCEPVSSGDADDPATHDDYLQVALPADRDANRSIMAPGRCGRQAAHLSFKTSLSRLLRINFRFSKSFGSGIFWTAPSGR
jgi:hypothetical protein